AEDGIRDRNVTGVQTCALPIYNPVFAIDEPIQVIGKDIDINNSQMSKLQIGDKHRTLSEYQAQANKQMMTVASLEERANRLDSRSEERRVGKEGRGWRGARDER